MLIFVAGICCATGFAPEATTTTIDNHRLLSQFQLDIAIEAKTEEIVLASSNPFLPSSIEVIKKEVISEEDSSMTTEVPPVLHQIIEERKKFQINLGKAMDTLRKDMPYILKETPDYSIYHENISVVDPSGVQIKGVESYKSSIKFMQQFINFWFQERSGLQYRLVYDFARSSIRVSWHAVLVPKMPLGRPLFVDGISMYQFDADSGKITEHKFETLTINNTPVMPPYGVFSLLQQEWGLAGTAQPGAGVPAGV